MSVLSRVGGPALAVVLALGSVAGASAASAAPTPSGDRWGPRLTQACSRVATRISKVERLQQRLHAGEGTRGSIAHLQGRIDRAEAGGREDVVRLLTDRLAVRKDLDAALPDVLTHLRDARAVCAKHAPAASASGSASS